MTVCDAQLMDDDVPQADLVRSLEEFIDFVEKLRVASAVRPVPEWDSRNWDLDAFLGAVHAWVSDAPSDQIPDEVPWHFVARVFAMGRTYE